MIIQGDNLEALKALLPYDKIVVYGEASRIGAVRLKALNIEFKQTPYDVRVK